MSPSEYPQIKSNNSQAQLLHYPPQADHTMADSPEGSSSDEDQVAQTLRAKLVVYALQKVEKYCQVHIVQGHEMPSEELLDAIEDLVIALAADPSTEWPWSSWSFLADATKMAHEITQRTRKWRTLTRKWPKTSGID